MEDEAVGGDDAASTDHMEDDAPTSSPEPIGGLALPTTSFGRPERHEVVPLLPVSRAVFSTYESGFFMDEEFFLRTKLITKRGSGFFYLP
jgi:hypothetical protein